MANNNKNKLEVSLTSSEVNKRLDNKRDRSNNNMVLNLTNKEKIDILECGHPNCDIHQKFKAKLSTYLNSKNKTNKSVDAFYDKFVVIICPGKNCGDGCYCYLLSGCWSAGHRCGKGNCKCSCKLCDVFIYILFLLLTFVQNKNCDDTMTILYFICL
jgi:hypothetical protein